MSENEKKLKEEKKLTKLRERLKRLKGVKGQASDFDIEQMKDSISNVKDKMKEAPSRETLEKLKNLVPAEERFMKDGGAVRKGDSETVKMYKHGGEVKSKKSKVAGRLAQRGYGKARK